MNRSNTFCQRFLTLFFSILWAFTNVSLQAQIANQPDSIKPAPVYISLSQVPSFGTSTRQLISTTEQFLLNNNQLEVLKGDFLEALTIIDEKIAFLSDTVRVYRMDRLNKEEQELKLLEDRFSQWTSIIQAWVNETNAREVQLEYHRDSWKFTLDSVRTNPKFDVDDAEGSSLVSIEKTFKEHIASIDQLLIKLNNWQTRLISAQADLSYDLDQLKKAQTLLLEEKEQIRNQIWIPEYPPIWKLQKDTTASTERRSFKEILEGDQEIIAAYLENNPGLPYDILFYFILIYVTILYLRRHARKLFVSVRHELREGKIILRHPFFTALILTWLLSFLLYDLPNEINRTSSLLMLIPLLYMLRKMNPVWTWRRLLLFSVAYLVFLFLPNILHDNLTTRIILLVVDTAAFFLFFKIYRNNELIEGYKKYWLGLLPSLINLFMFLCILVFVAVVLGSIQLTQLLLSAILGTILTFIVLRTAIGLGKSLLFLLILGPLYKRSYILQQDSDMILQRMERIFTILGVLAWVLVFLRLMNLDKQVIGALFNFINAPVTVGELSISLGNILAFVIVIQISQWLSNFIRYVLDKEVFPRVHTKEGVPNTISLMVRFTLTLFGILFAFAAAGVKIDKLAVGMGALGVGIGFGLQNIVNNFISGVILALERPMKIGDTVDVNEVSGIVKDIGLRASMIRTWDGSDVLVPNGELLSVHLTNWTLLDKRRRIKTAVRVPFDTDMQQLMKVLLEIAGEIPDIMKKPGPYLHLRGIGDSAMEVDLYCWIPDVDKVFSMGTKIREHVYHALREKGYDIPLPKQNLLVEPEPKQKSSSTRNKQKSNSKPSTPKDQKENPAKGKISK